MLRNAFHFTLILPTIAAAAFGLSAGHAVAKAADTEKLLTWQADYVADGSGVVQGPITGTRYTGYASLAADASLEKSFGWQGAHVFLHGIASMGGRPNDLAGTLQGINNIEVENNRAKLYELYFEQHFGNGNQTFRLGFSDLNSEFYATDSSTLLLAPAFGVGSELAATGPNGPAIFPSTAFMARLHLETAAGAYAQAAVINAEAGVIGDAGGVRPLFGKGALVIGEIGTTHGGQLALGAWHYTAKQEDIRVLSPNGDPQRRQAYGFYALFDHPVWGNDERGVNLFARAGISDGVTTPYTGGWQAGLLARGLIKGRPDSQLSLGMNQAFVSGRYRQNAADLGQTMRRKETAAELTFADKPVSWLTIQPDFQYIWNAQNGPNTGHAMVVAVRLRFSFASE